MNRGSMRAGIEKTGPLEESVCRVIAYQVLQGLAHLHSKLLIHRDIKPDNILMCAFQRCAARLLFAVF